MVVVTHGDAHEMCSAHGVAHKLSDGNDCEACKLAISPRCRPAAAVTLRVSFAALWFAIRFCAARFCKVCHPHSKLTCGLIDRASGWRSTLLHMVEEAASEKAGSEAVLAKMSEALFVDTLRRYLAGLPEQEVGWLAAARDPMIGKSLMLLHSRTPHPWTHCRVGEGSRSSRSALVERFTRYLSEPPMAYLIRWRLQLAARALASTSRGVAEIAEDVGYESEAAFNRAFKREFGSPPARYRNEHRTASGFAA